MGQGIVLSPENGRIGEGTAVGPTNPMPVYNPSGYGMQVTYGSYVADVVPSGAAAGTADAGLIFMGLDTVGTYYPLPLSSGGGAVLVSGSFGLSAGTNAIGTVTVANNPAIAAGTNTIGTVAAAYYPATLSTCIPMTGTTVATLIAATAGSYNYIMGIQLSNSSGTLTTAMILDNAAWKKTLALAANGGGNNIKYSYPGWKAAGTNTITAASLSVGVGTVWANIDWYVAP